MVCRFHRIAAKCFRFHNRDTGFDVTLQSRNAVAEAPGRSDPSINHALDTNIVRACNQLKPACSCQLPVVPGDWYTEDAVNRNAQGRGFAFQCSAAADDAVGKPNYVKTADDVILRFEIHSRQRIRKAEF